MDGNKIIALAKLAAKPALLIVLGLVLLVTPGSAVALVTRVLAWLLIAYGGFRVICLAAGHSRHGIGRWLGPLLVLGAGVYMLSNPMVLANVAGRIVGLLLILGALEDLRASQGGFRIVTLATLGVGIVLILLPQTLTKTLLGLVGLVLIAVGTANLLGRLRMRALPEQTDDPNIIDADE